MGDQDVFVLTEKQKTDAYAKWTGKSEIKLLISLLPKLETDIQRDCFTALLRSVFDAGYDCGSGSTAGAMLKAIMEGDRDRSRRG